VEMFQGVISDDMGMATSFASILIVSALIPLLLLMKFTKGDRASLF